MQNCLTLSCHPAVQAAAAGALGTHRLVAPRPGLTAHALALEDSIGGFLQFPVTVTFPSGSEAIRRTLRSPLHPGDHVIVDSAAHPATFETVRLSLARQHRALHIVDVTHDLGALGPSGGEVPEIQACQGRIDVLLGSFAKTFGAGGRFAAFRDPGLMPNLTRADTHTTALSPVNAAAILAALEIISAPEGRSLHGLSLCLRNHLMVGGIRPPGKATPFVPILLPRLTALARTAPLESAGPRVSLLQGPNVPLHAPRWRIQLTAAHGPGDIDDLAELIRDVTRAFDLRKVRSHLPA